MLETESVIAFRDINPQAPTHILVVPKKHIKNAVAFERKDQTLIFEVFDAIRQIAESEKLESGFRVIGNIGNNGGQTIDHVHFHILGGRLMQWPPG